MKQRWVYLTILILELSINVQTKHFILNKHNNQEKNIKHNGLFPELPPFIQYVSQNDFAWSYFSNCIYNIFDQNQDFVLQSSEWKDTVQGITGSESIGETSLIIYYGILVGTLEVRLEIQYNDWNDFMDLVRDYIIIDINQNPIPRNNTTVQLVDTLQIKKNILGNSFRGFLSQIKEQPQLKLRHQALGSYLCNNAQYWNFIVQFLFKLFDLDEDKYIQKSELIQVVKNYQVKVSAKCGIKVPFDEYWSFIDTNNDDKLSLTEWNDAMGYAKSIVEPELNKIIPNIDFDQLLKAIF